MSNLTSEPATLASHVDWPTFKPALGKRKFKAVLTVDGGGLRGMLPARLLEELEGILKQLIMDRGLVDAEGKAAPKDGSFNIDLADYFDVMAGTSTGSIITTYLATKGQMSVDFLKSDKDVMELYKGGTGQQTKNLHARYKSQYLRPGSCRAAQAVFLAKRNAIFKAYTGPGDWIATLLARLSGVDVLKDVAAVKYVKDGINDTLRAVFGGNPKLGNKGDGSSLSDRRLSDTLHTSLVIPAFQMNTSRTLTFWHKHVSEDGLTPEEILKQRRRNTGYATLRRGASDGEKAASEALMGVWLKEQIAQHKAMQQTAGIPEIVYVPNTDFNLWQVVRSSTAAPSFFPPCTMKPIVSPAPASAANWVQDDGAAAWRMVDGGVTANDPAMAAVTFASSAFHDLTGLDQLAVLSIGCGTAVKPVDVNDNAGLLGWGMGGLIDVLMGGNQELSSALVEHFVSKKYSNNISDVDVSDRYVRIQKTATPPQDPKDIPADNTIQPVGGRVKPKGETLAVDNKEKPLSEVLASMDVPDNVPYFHRLAEVMLDEKSAENDGKNVRTILQEFAEHYLLPKDVAEQRAALKAM